MRQTRSTRKNAASASKDGTTPMNIDSTPAREPTRRSTRQTKKPQLLQDERADLLTSKPKEPPGKRAKTTRKTPQKKAKKPDNKIFTPKSKFASIDLAEFLSDEKVWIGLTQDQKAFLKASCHRNSKWGQSSDDQPNLGLLMFDMHWKSDVRMFKEDLLNGFYEEEWIEEAEEAAVDRDNGKFDEWKLKNFEEYWGQRMNQEERILEARRQSVSLTELFADGFVKRGDVWFYSRPFGKGKKMIVIGYEIVLYNMDDYGQAEFRVKVPAGHAGKRALEAAAINPSRSSKRRKTARGSTTPTLQEQGDIDMLESSAKEQNTKDNATDLVTPEYILHIHTDQVPELERQLLNHDGRKKKPDSVGSWEYFTVQRDGAELGRLVDLRDQYFDEHIKQQQQ